MATPTYVPVLLCALAVTCGTPSPTSAPTTPSVTPASTPTSVGTSEPAQSGTPHPPAPGNDAAFDLELPVGQLPRDVTVHDGQVWVANARSGSVWAINPGSGQVVAEVATDPRPISFASIDGQLWVSVLGAGTGVVGEGIVRIDTTAGTVADEIDIPVQHDLAVGSGSLWVLDGERHVQRVRPSSGTITSIDVGGRPVAVDANNRWVWLVREDGTTVQIDVSSNTVSAQLDTGEPAPGRSMTLIIDDEVWIAATDRVYIIDADDTTRIGTVDLEGLQGTTGIAADDRSVWLASTTTEPDSALTQGVVLRIDRSTRKVEDRFPVAGEPAGLALDGATVWVADQQRNVLLRLRQNGT